MSKIFKNIAPYWRSVIIILALLFVQAWCDLSLPSYTSDIIDVGIQNRGVEHVIPKEITEEDYKSAMLFMTEAEKTLWENSYEKEDSNYVRADLSEEELEGLDEELILPLLMNYQMSQTQVMMQNGMDEQILMRLRQKAEIP